MTNRFAALLVTFVFASCGGSDGSPTSVNTGGNNNGGNTTGNSVQNSASISIVQTTQTDPYYGMTYGYGFTPSTATIAKGGTITWVNSSGVTHNIVFSGTGAPANVGEFSSGTKSTTFAQTGSFAFACTLHAGMTGVVTVQ